MADMNAVGEGQQGPLRVRSALFVDFENIHMGLQRLDPAAANRFAINPQGWLGWLEKLGYPALTTDDFRRDLLIRYCYLNPVSSARYRAYFTRAGFHVVDCPPLTAAGKNSADIHIVIDVLDILVHPTRFDEVVLLSADADYTPVMLRLRAHDRRTVIITSGPSARAFRAACDHVVGEDTFIDEALSADPRPLNGPGCGHEPAPAPGGSGSGQASGPAGTPAPSSEPAPLVLAAHAGHAAQAEGPDGQWVSPAEALPRSLSTGLGPGSLPTSSRYLGPARSLAVPAAQLSPPSSSSAAHLQQDGLLRHVIAAKVRDLVAASDRPITLASAAQLVRADLGQDVTDGWAGTGSFKKLLALADLPGLAISAAPEYIYDPRRHSPPPSGTGPVLGIGHHDQDGPRADLVVRISQVTDIPRLSSREFRMLFEELAAEVAAHGFSRTGTSRAVRDRCAERGEHVGRGAVNFVLNGLLYAGRPPRPGDDAGTLALAFADNAVVLCQNARMELSAEEIAHLRSWISDAPALVAEAGPEPVVVQPDS